MMDVLTSETCWALNNEIIKASDIKLVSLYWTMTQYSLNFSYIVFLFPWLLFDLSQAGLYLTLILLRWRIWRTCNNASRWQIGFKSAFKGVKGLLMLLISMETRNVYLLRDGGKLNFGLISISKTRYLVRIAARNTAILLPACFRLDETTVCDTLGT